jgi:hypothetical protein
LEKPLKHFKVVYYKQINLKQPTLNIAPMVEPKAKRKYKIKKKKEKDVAFEELATISKVMVEGDLLEDEA